MSLDTILDTIAKEVGKLEELKLSQQVGGRFNLEELRRRAVKMPAAFVACLGTDDGRVIGSAFRAKGLFILVLAVESRAEGLPEKQDRTRNIHRLLTRALLKVAKAGTWGSPEIEGTPQNIAARNAYTSKGDANNLALWGITWEQQLALAEEPVPAALPDFLTAPTSYQATDTGPPIDAVDNITLQEP